ncbi:MAG: AsmA-like C-terminal region-containing protein [Chitinophagales bacterium]
MLRKVLIGVGVFLLLLVVTVIALPFIFKDKINALVKEEINKNLNAKVDYSDYGLTLISSFPNFTLTLENLSVVGTDNFKGDTLAAVKHTAVTIDLMSVVKGEKYKLLAFTLEQPTVHAIVDYDGKANWDIVKPTPAAAPASQQSKFALEAKKVEIKDGDVTYDDRKGGSFASLHDLDFEGSGDVTQDIYDLATKTTVGALTYKSGLVAYLSKAKLDATINLAIDNRINKYTFKENSINLNDLGLQFDGYVQTQKDDINLDVNFKSKKTEFKSILSLLPAVYAKDFDKIKTSGTLDLKGSVKGLYNDKTYPGFNLDWKVADAMFQYPDLPVAVRNINIVSTVVKPQGSLDLTVVDIPKLHFEAGTDPVDAKINVKTPVSDPNVSADIHGSMNLANVPKFYPMEGVKSIAGLLKLNLLFKGRKSDLDRKNYEAITAAGDANISGLYYDSKDLPMPLRVNTMQMNFSPQNIKLSNLVAVIGHSDINASGTLDNFMSYLFGKGDLVGTLNLKSGVFDANEWLSKDANAPASGSVKDTARTEFFKVPAHIDFTANSEFGKIFYDKIVLQNVKGEVVVKDEAIHLNNLFANLLGGSATISANYITKNLNHPDVSFTYDIKNFDIQQTYKAVDLSAKMAPVIKHINGEFSSDLKGSGKLNPDMSVDYQSLTGDGKVELTNAKITGLPMLAEITKVAKIPALQNLELKQGWTVLKFKDGKVNVDPTDIKFGNGYNINFKGANGFDQTIDYDVRLDVPSKELGPATSVAQSMLAKVPGVNAAMPEVVGFLFKVTGPFSKPQVKLNKVTAGGNSVKDVITNTAEDLKKQAEEEAKKKAEELKKQAEDQLNKQKQAAQDAIDKAKRDAEQKAKEAADKAKKEAEDKLKNVIKWPK